MRYFTRLFYLIMAVLFALFLLGACATIDAHAGTHCGDMPDGSLYCTDAPDTAPLVVAVTERTGNLASYLKFTNLGHQVAPTHRWSAPVPPPAPLPLPPIPTPFAYQPAPYRSCIGPHEHAWSSLPVSDCGTEGGPGPWVTRNSGLPVVPHSYAPQTVNVRLVD